MNPTDHQRIITELNVLLHQLAKLMQRFEATGFNVTMKDDYVALHGLQHRILEMRLAHSQASDEVIAPCAIPKERH